MGFELNSEAYVLFAKIEVALREFLIKIIKEKSVHEWTKNFLGKVHLDSIKEIGKRIFEATEKQMEPKIEDIYLSKIYRELRKETENFRGSDLLHPFYYLNWSEFTGVISKNPNFDIISSLIGRQNLDTLIHNLKSLNFLRNDVAHSRFISEKQLIFIKSSYDQISITIPDFYLLLQIQSHEETIASLFKSLVAKIDQIEDSSMLSISSINEIEDLLRKIINSFWINSFFSSALDLVCLLQNQVTLYKKSRQTPGGLLSIQKWSETNTELLSNIKKEINDRKIPD